MKDVKFEIILNCYDEHVSDQVIKEAIHIFEETIPKLDFFSPGCEMTKIKAEIKEDEKND